MKWIGVAGPEKGTRTLAIQVARDRAAAAEAKEERVRAAVHKILVWTRSSAPMRKLCRGERRWVAARQGYERATYRCTSCGRVSYYATPECYPLVGDGL